MENKKTLIVIGIILLFLFGLVIFISNNTKKSTISHLYSEKGLLMTQKSELLKQDLTIRNKLDEINKEVINLDAKLYKLINPILPVQAIEPTGAIEMVDKALNLSQSTGK